MISDNQETWFLQQFRVTIDRSHDIIYLFFNCQNSRKRYRNKMYLTIAGLVRRLAGRAD